MAISADALALECTDFLKLVTGPPEQNVLDDMRKLLEGEGMTNPVAAVGVQPDELANLCSGGIGGKAFLRRVVTCLAAAEEDGKVRLANAGGVTQMLHSTAPTGAPAAAPAVPRPTPDMVEVLRSDASAQQVAVALDGLSFICKLSTMCGK